MTASGPRIKGEVAMEAAITTAYAQDRSRYAIRPKMVAFPADEEDLVSILDFARQNSIPITARGAGSNQSGSSVGGGILTVFRDMRRIVRVDRDSATVQAGTVFDILDDRLGEDGRMIPYDPSSRSFCTIGGNLGTNASGLHSLKYGDTDRAVRAVRFVHTRDGLVDTSEGLPEALERDIVDLRRMALDDPEVRRKVEGRRGLKASSGYNLRAFFDHHEAEDILAHLLVGSVGTLGLFSQVSLRSVPVPQDRVLAVLFFESLGLAVRSVDGLLELGPAALEAMDCHGVEFLRSDLSMAVPREAKAVLFAEFEDRRGDLRPEAVSRMAQGALAIELHDQPGQIESLWKVRESMLPRIIKERENEGQRFLPFADDMSVPPSRLPEFLEEVQAMFRAQGLEVVIYGHAGQGNLHMRPLIGKDHWRQDLRKLTEKCFQIVSSYGGTLTGEHGVGRNRAMFIRREWGDACYGLFEAIKERFDPRGLLNPGVFFAGEDVAKGLRF